MPEITFTLDLEDSRASSEGEPRLASVDQRLLPFLARLCIRGTIFVVGELARVVPDLVRGFAEHGHEIGLHGYRHVPLPTLTPDDFRADVRRGKAELEALLDREVIGFRAPFFSLNRDSVWATTILAEEGFTYSSSALPARSPLYGFPECPAAPFRWPSGLLELPVPVASVRGTGVPFLGGAYLRLLPRPIVRAALRGFGRRQALWTYCHPYDFDPGEPFRVRPELGWAKSKLLWHNRDAMLAKLDWLLESCAAPPLAERVAAGIALSAAPPALG